MSSGAADAAAPAPAGAAAKQLARYHANLFPRASPLYLMPNNTQHFAACIPSTQQHRCCARPRHQRRYSPEQPH
eukprot:3569249-Rhodomonas_salina.1